MATEQLNLLEWRPACRVHAFPPARNIERVRWVADKLDRKHAKAATAYWKQTVTRLVNEFRQAGVPEAEIDATVREFFDAVQRELVRMAYQGQGTGGAA